MTTNQTSQARTLSWQLGHQDAVRYGIPRNLRDYPNGTMQAEYEKGYQAGTRRCQAKRK